MLKKNDLLRPNFIGKRHAECAMELSEASTLKRNSYHENTDPNLHEKLEKKGVSNVKYRVSQTVRNKHFLKSSASNRCETYTKESSKGSRV